MSKGRFKKPSTHYLLVGSVVAGEGFLEKGGVIVPRLHEGTSLHRRDFDCFPSSALQAFRRNQLRDVIVPLESPGCRLSQRSPKRLRTGVLQMCHKCQNSFMARLATSLDSGSGTLNLLLRLI